MSIHEHIWNWLHTYPGFDRIAYNFGVAADGNTSLVPVATDRCIKADIFGNETRHYDFAVSAFRMCTEQEECLENLVDFNELQEFIDWIELQNVTRAFPTLSASCVVKSVHALQNTPTVAMQIDDMAKYIVQARITYINKED